MGEATNKKAGVNKPDETSLKMPVPRLILSLKKPGILAGFLVLFVFLAFWRVLNNDFLTYDDFTYVTGNEHVQRGLEWFNVKWAFETWWAANWHPLTWLSHMLDCQIFGLHPWGHHLTSLMLHALNTALVFFVLRRMTGAIWQSAFVAALFGVHPLHVESVAWVAERKDVLSTMFWMSSLLAYARFVEESKTPKAAQKFVFYALSVIFLAFGLMSKPMLVSVPFLMLLLDYWPLRRWEGKAVVRLFFEKVPFFILAGISMIITFQAQKHGETVASVEGVPVGIRMENALVSYVLYLGKLVCPIHLAVIYPYPEYLSAAEVLSAALIVAGISAFVFTQRRLRPFLFVGWAWFLGTLVPVIGLVQVGPQSMADRYTYVPAIGIFIALTWWTVELTKQFRQQVIVLAGCALIILIACAAATFHQTGYWKDSGTLFRHAVAVTRNNGVAYAQLADYQMDQGHLEQAIETYREAIKLQPEFPLIYDHLGVAFCKEGQISEGIVQFKKASQMDPGLPAVHDHLGLAMKDCGRIDDAMAQYEELVRLSPSDAHGHAEFGLMLQRNGRLTEAIHQYEMAINLDPDLALTYYNLGLALENQGRMEDAFNEIKQCLKLTPDFAEAHNELGVLLASQERLDEAISQFREAIRLQPEYTNAQQNLSLALKMKQDVPSQTGPRPPAAP